MEAPRGRDFVCLASFHPVRGLPDVLVHWVTEAIKGQGWATWGLLDTVTRPQPRPGLHAQAERWPPSKEAASRTSSIPVVAVVWGAGHNPTPRGLPKASRASSPPAPRETSSFLRSCGGKSRTLVHHHLPYHRFASCPQRPGAWLPPPRQVSASLILNTPHRRPAQSRVPCHPPFQSPHAPPPPRAPLAMGRLPGVAARTMGVIFGRR